LEAAFTAMGDCMSIIGTNSLHTLISRLGRAAPAACFGAALMLGACSGPDTEAPATPDPAPAEVEAAPAAETAAEAASETIAPTLLRTIELDASAETVWALIGPFCSIADWHPVVGSCTLGDGPTRTIVTVDGAATFVEREIARDDSGRHYAYRIESSPLPVIDYVATFGVAETGPDSSTLIWASHYTALDGQDEAAAAALTGIYESGMAGIVARLAE
jgi:hypothetical protein